MTEPASTSSTRYWVNIISHNHVLKAVEGEFIQADRSQGEGLGQLTKGDKVLFYSPRTSFRKGRLLQEFTALGTVEDEEPYLFELNQNNVSRRKMWYTSSCQTPIKPLVEHLSFLPDKEKWELPFRKGLFEIPVTDFTRIAQAMGAEAQ